MPENNGRSGRKPPPASGRFKKGESGNPGGRPKGLAAMVRAKTKDGAQLVDTMVQIALGKLRIGKRYPSHRDRREAVAWLADRGFGKAPDKVELSGPDGQPLSTGPAWAPKLTLEQAKRLREIAEDRAHRGGDDHGSPATP